ncbi:hypothetical protein N806_02450 [Rhodococcus sp. P27]|nr:hypothetical protein N601_00835 [Rhodococcus erythropolis DN1]ERB50054.1 hypothetical protein N806_02450 [Rhodococcus sp. P27]
MDEFTNLVARKMFRHKCFLKLIDEVGARGAPTSLRAIEHW